jgi:hypothetical protein
MRVVIDTGVLVTLIPLRGDLVSSALKGADESAPQYVKVLRTHRPVRKESDKSDFHELSRGLSPARAIRVIDTASQVTKSSAGSNVSKP